MLVAHREPASDAAKRLFGQYGDEVYQYVRFTLGEATEAEDVVQDVFLEVLRAWPRFRGLSSEKTWLWSIARHRLIDHLRRLSRLGRDLSRRETGRDDPMARDIATRVDVECSLQYLPVAQRQVVILRIIQDHTTAEVSRMLGWPQVRVRVTLHRALKVLSSLLHDGEACVVKEGAHQ